MNSCLERFQNASFEKFLDPWNCCVESDRMWHYWLPNCHIVEPSANWQLLTHMCAHADLYTKKKLNEREINWKLGWFKNSRVPLIKRIYLDQKVFLLHKPVVNMDHNSQWQISKM